MENNKISGTNNAFSLFPELMDSVLSGKRNKPDRIPPSPPPPPDISWLRTGQHEVNDQTRDVPSALVLMPENKNKDIVTSILQKLSYQIVIMDSPQKGIEKTRSAQLAVTILHSAFEPGGLPASTFHDYMRRLPMDRRRMIYYVLIGPEFHTSYNLEACALSANLVVNDREIQYLDVILRKGIREYEELFGPFFETLAGYGKR